MKKTVFTSLFVVAFLLLQTVVIAQEKFQRDVKGFKSIKLSGGFDVVLSPDKSESLTIQATKDDADVIITEVVGSTLEVRVKKGYYGNLKATIYISFIAIEGIESSGSSDVKTTGAIEASVLKVGISGSGDMALEMNVGKFDSHMSGSGNLTLKGKATEQDYFVSGSCDIRAFELAGEKCAMTISGSGDAEVCASKEISARVSGSGDIKYKGSPDRTDIKVSGSGEIRKVD